MHQICLRHVVRTPQHPRLNLADSGLQFRLNREGKHQSASVVIFNAALLLCSVCSKLNEARNAVWWESL